MSRSTALRFNFEGKTPDLYFFVSFFLILNQWKLYCFRGVMILILLWYLISTKWSQCKLYTRNLQRDLDSYPFFFTQPCLCGFNTLFLRTRHNSCSIVGRIGISLNERVSSDIYSDGGHNLINKAGPSRHFNATPGIGSDNGS